MTKPKPQPPEIPRMQRLSAEERKSLTHGNFWIPEEEREIYKVALQTLNEAGIPYVVAGAYAVYEHAGIYRQTKDLDLFCEPEHVVAGMRALKAAGFRTRLEQPHWLAKALHGDHFLDLIFGMGNGLKLIDPAWYRHSKPAILAGTPVRVAPAEELIWHRLFIHERHRQDMADVAHLILCLGHRLDWDRLLHTTGDDWPLLLSHLMLYRYIYPGYREQVPDRILRDLLARADADVDVPSDRSDGRSATRGTLISRFSFNIDVHEWGFHDLRTESVDRRLRDPRIRAIEDSDVWDERADFDSPAPAPAVATAGVAEVAE
jgi:hypothetical protein